MNEINWIEAVGYMASVFIAVSITMNSIVKLRVINLIGAILLGTYGMLIESVPIILLNYFIGITNIFYLWKILKSKKEDNRNLS